MCILKKYISYSFLKNFLRIVFFNNIFISLTLSFKINKTHSMSTFLTNLSFLQYLRFFFQLLLKILKKLTLKKN